MPEPFLGPRGVRIGEVWFEPSAELPELLAKYIFTSDRLSVQVHPSDAQTQADGLGQQGKEECWLVIEAEPDATLGIGFQREVDAETMRAAALDGSIDALLAWYPVKAGDFFYIPANTVHAIGAGVSLIELQQNSDITYRLYDYGRPRELHLDAGMRVSSGLPYDESLRAFVPEEMCRTLVDGPLFQLDQICGPPSQAIQERYGLAPVLVLPRTGTVQVAGVHIDAGECAVAPSLVQVAPAPGSSCLVAQSLRRAS